MTSDDIRLVDFVLWIRKRRIYDQAAWVDEKTLEHVTQGIERFLDGKNPWPKPKGNKPKRLLMWECYQLTNFAEWDKPHLPQHSEEGGAFKVIGDRLGLSPKTVEFHARKARKLLDTAEGRGEFGKFLSDYRYNGGSVLLASADHPSSIADRERREAAGLGNPYAKAERKRRRIAVSGLIDPI